MIEELSFIGEPIEFTNKIFIYPPKVKDVLKNQNILRTYKILTQSQEDVIDLLAKQKSLTPKIPTPLEFFLANCYNSKEFEQVAKEGLQGLLHEQIFFGYEHKIILIGDYEELSKLTDVNQVRMINEENFFDFQNCLRVVFGERTVTPYVAPENPLVAKIKAKTRERERRAQKAKEKKGGSLFNSMKTICFMGCGITPFNVGELPYSALTQLMKVYQAKEKYDKDMLIISGGADPKKVKPKYWLSALEEKDEASQALKNLSEGKDGSKKI